MKAHQTERLPKFKIRKVEKLPYVVDNSKLKNFSIKVCPYNKITARKTKSLQKNSGKDNKHVQ